MSYSIKPETCSICAKVLTIHDRVIGQTCSSLACKTRHFQLTSKELQQRQSKELNRILGQVNQDRTKAAMPAASAVFKTPYRERRETIPSKEKIQNFKQYLKKSIRDSGSIENSSDTSELSLDVGAKEAGTAEEIPVSTYALQAGCATCGGFCCVQGGEHAFLTAAIMRKRLADRSNETPAAVYRNYLKHLPAVSIAGTCVYHTSTGCSISRDMRADICNTYECKDLENIRAHTQPSAWQPIVVVAMDDTRVANVSVVNSESMESLGNPHSSR